MASSASLPASPTPLPDRHPDLAHGWSTMTSALRAHRTFLGLVAGLALVAGTLAGQTWGGRVYHASTSVLFDRGAYQRAWDTEAPQPNQLVGLLESPATLERARRSLAPQVTRQELEDAVRATLDRDTGFLRLDVDWTTAEGAPRVASLVRDAFLQRCRSEALQAARQRVEALEAERTEQLRVFQRADQHLAAFLREHRVSASFFAQGLQTTGPEANWGDGALPPEQASSGLFPSRSDAMQKLANERQLLAVQLQGAVQELGVLRGQLAEVRAHQEQVHEAQLRALHLQGGQERLEEEAADARLAVDVVKGRLAFERSAQLRQRGLLSQEQYETAAAEQQKLETSHEVAPKVRMLHDMRRLNAELVPPEASPPGRDKLRAVEERVALLRLQDRQMARQMQRQQAHEALARERARRRSGLEGDYQRNVRERDLAERTLAATQGSLHRQRYLVAVQTRQSQGDVAGFRIEAEPLRPLTPARSRGHLVALVTMSGILLMGLVRVFWRPLTLGGMQTLRTASLYAEAPAGGQASTSHVGTPPGAW